MLKDYRIPCRWTVQHTLTVRGRSIEHAMQKIRDTPWLLKNGEVLVDSLTMDPEAIRIANILSVKDSITLEVLEENERLDATRS